MKLPSAALISSNQLTRESMLDEITSEVS
jgi:hypothetical protein